MKTSRITLYLPMAAVALLTVSCTSTRHKAAAPAAVPATSGVVTGKNGGQKKADSPPKAAAAAQADDDLDEYAVVEIADPLEKLNRATFRGNEFLYNYLMRPVSKGYEKVLPKRLRNGINNAFENVRFPVRFVNNALQGKLKNAGKETGKLVINSVAGVGGLIRVADKIPALADVPDEDTGQTLAAWGIGHGAYIVLPFLGPSSVREGVGLAGDYALNPVNWGMYWGGDHDWTHIVQGANTLRNMPAHFAAYDAATKDAVDPYLSMRSAYVQNRAEAARR